MLTFAAQAQDETIAYGETINGTISDQNFEIAYTFSGGESDVIVAELESVDALGELERPILLLVNSQNEILGDTAETFSYQSALLAAELPAEETYTLLVTRENGRAGDDVGDFTLRLLLAPEIVAGRVVEDSSGTDAPKDYFVARQSGSPATLVYHKVDGDFAPEIAVHRIEEGALTPVISMSGSELADGQVTLPSSGSLYVISVGEAPFDFSFGDLKVTYELSIS
jgi:hypothetical protein